MYLIIAAPQQQSQTLLKFKFHKVMQRMKPIVQVLINLHNRRAICDLYDASNDAQSTGQGSVSRGLKCQTEPDLRGGSRTRCCETSSSGGWPGLIPLLLEIDPASQAKRAGERAYSAQIKCYLAKYDWMR